MGKHDIIAWTPDFELSVLEAIQSGSTLRQTAQQHGISDSAIMRRVYASPSFEKQYAHAIAVRSDLEFERLVQMVEQAPKEVGSGEFVDSAWVQYQRLRVDTVKWALSKRNPKKYGEKMQLEHGLEPSLAERLDNARKRLESGS